MLGEAEAQGSEVFTGDELLRRPVQLHGIQLGSPVDLVLDLERCRALALEIRCGDDRRRLLPLGAAVIDGDHVEVASALALIDEGGAGFYRDRATSLRSLRGAHVVSAGTDHGGLADVVLGQDWTVEGLVVEGGGEVSTGPHVAVGGKRLRC